MVKQYLPHLNPIDLKSRPIEYTEPKAMTEFAPPTEDQHLSLLQILDTYP